MQWGRAAEPVINWLQHLFWYTSSWYTFCLFRFDRLYQHFSRRVIPATQKIGFHRHELEDLSNGQVSARFYYDAEATLPCQSSTPVMTQ